MRTDFNNLMKGLAGYEYFRDNSDNKFRKVLGLLETLDEALQAHAPEKEEAQMNLNAHGSELSRRWRQNRRWSPSESSTSSGDSRCHITSLNDSNDDPQRHRSSRSKRMEATLVEVLGDQGGCRHAGLKELLPTNPLY